MGVKRPAGFKGGAPSGGAETQPEGKFIPLSRLRKLRACEQVAAVCYRIRSEQIQFLLVRTRSGRRWTFPKGSAERGLSHAQAAALEAFEEAGVHGRIEEAAFTNYRRLGRNGNDSSTGGSINAHLCEVLRLGAPKESFRDRTWFPVSDARQRVCESRTQKQATQFVRVIDRAVDRIRRSLVGSRMNKNVRQFAGDSAPATPPYIQARSRGIDALQQVKFDFSEICGWMQNASFQNGYSRMNPAPGSSLPRVRQRVNVPCEILDFETAGKLKLPN